MSNSASTITNRRRVKAIASVTKVHYPTRVGIHNFLLPTENCSPNFSPIRYTTRKGCCILPTDDPIEPPTPTPDTPLPPDDPPPSGDNPTQTTDNLVYRMYRFVNNTSGYLNPPALTPVFASRSSWGVRYTVYPIFNMIFISGKGLNSFVKTRTSSNSEGFIIIEMRGFFTPHATGYYKFNISSDNGVGLSVNTNVLINTVDPPNNPWTSLVSLTTNRTGLLEQGIKYPIKIVYVNGSHIDSPPIQCEVTQILFSTNPDGVYTNIISTNNMMSFLSAT